MFHTLSRYHCAPLRPNIPANTKKPTNSISGCSSHPKDGQRRTAAVIANIVVGFGFLGAEHPGKDLLDGYRSIHHLEVIPVLLLNSASSILSTGWHSEGTAQKKTCLMFPFAAVRGRLLGGTTLIIRTSWIRSCRYLFASTISVWNSGTGGESPGPQGMKVARAPDDFSFQVEGKVFGCGVSERPRLHEERWVRTPVPDDYAVGHDI